MKYKIGDVVSYAGIDSITTFGIVLEIKTTESAASRVSNTYGVVNKGELIYLDHNDVVAVYREIENKHIS